MDDHQRAESVVVHSADRSVRSLLVVLTGFGTIVVVQAALGFAGWLNGAPIVLGGIAVTAAVAVVIRQARTEPGRVDPVDARGPWTRVDFAGAAALIAAFVDRAWTGLHRKTFLYDVLSYHLHLPAAWRAAGRLTIVPTPFGDPAPAYTPSNAELLYHLAIALTGNATLAHAGQIPFAALATLAIYSTARVVGAARAAAFAAALAFLLVPEVWQQTPTAMADLAMASFFLAAIPFLMRLEFRRAWSDVVGAALALGLLVGTKYVSVVLAAPIALWGAIALIRRVAGRRRGLAMAAVTFLTFACGGFWYVRNVIVAGNPLFPATLRVGSLTLTRGLVDGALMRTSDYHHPVRDIEPLLEIFAEVGWGLLAAAFAATVVLRRSRWSALAAVVAALCWFVVPFQQSRFFFALWGVVALMLAAMTSKTPRAGAVALAVATVGSIVQFPTAGRLAVLGTATLAAVGGPWIAAALRKSFQTVLGFQRRPAIRSAVIGCATVTIFLATLAWARGQTDTVAYEIGDDHDGAWAWIADHTRAKRIAYTGSNLPFPLWGPRFENDVRYVNIAGGTGAAAHNFLDVPAATAEPAPERQRPDVDAWLSNLDANHINLLFVARMYPGVVRANVHDDDGFPIERTWADTRPSNFCLVFSNPGIRIYERRPAPPTVRAP
jgi:hypothetical protein